MNTKLIIIISFSYIYGFFELFMGLRQKKRQNIIKTNNKLSIWILITCISIGYVLSFAIAATKTGRIYHWNLLFIIGLILIIAGLSIRLIAIGILKSHFTYTVSEIKNHLLIEDGFYKTIRHPGYLGQLVIFLGISTALSNWLSILLMMIPAIIGYSYRISIEEQFMCQEFGDKYKAYINKTKKFIPGIY